MPTNRVEPTSEKTTQVLVTLVSVSTEGCEHVTIVTSDSFHAVFADEHGLTTVENQTHVGELVDPLSSVSDLKRSGMGSRLTHVGRPEVLDVAVVEN